MKTIQEIIEMTPCAYTEWEVLQIYKRRWQYHIWLNFEDTTATWDTIDKAFNNFYLHLQDVGLIT